MSVAAQLHQQLRVTFVFTTAGIGGAERSMLRLIAHASRERMLPSVLFVGTANPPMQAELDRMGVVHRFVPGHFSIRKLRHAFHELKPQVAYFFGQLRTLVWAVAARRAGVRCLVGAERGSATRRVNTIGRSLDRFLLDGYIVNSRAAARSLQSRAHVPSARLHVVYNGIDQPADSAAPIGWPDAKRPLIACVANIRPIKGQMNLLRAARMLSAEYPGICVLLIGSDLTGGAFAQEAAEAGLASLYFATGYVSEVRPYIRAADLCVLPSTIREGMPTSILEAMSVGIPVVASDVGGVSELVQDGLTGLLARPNDVDDLARKIRQLLLDLDFRTRLVERARQHVERHHSISAMLENHLTVFRDLLERCR